MNNTTSHQGRFKSLRAAVGLRNEKNGYKIREATLQKVPYLLVIGEQEKAGAASPCWGGILKLCGSHPRCERSRMAIFGTGLGGRGWYLVRLLILDEQP